MQMFRLVLTCDLPDYRVDVAVNGQEVVDAFHDVHYGVIVLDIRMPLMNGDQAFEEIRRICVENTAVGYKLMDNVARIIGRRVSAMERTVRHLIQQSLKDKESIT